MSEPAVDAFLEEWHRVVARKDLPALRQLLTEDVSIGAPPYWARFEGVDLVHHLLGLVLTAIEGFTYHREWRSGAELALEFRGRVGDCELQGIDLITLDVGGQVRSLDVLVRPVNAVEALIETITPGMTAFLASRSAGQGP